MKLAILVFVSTSACFDFLEDPRRGCWWDYSSGERVKKCDEISNGTAGEEVMYENLLHRALAQAKPELLAVSLGLSRSTALAGQSKFSASGIFGKSGEECRCSDFTVRRKNGLYEGKCLSKFKGYYWCYLEENEQNCRDRTFKNGRYWSFSACYLDL